MGGPPEPFRAPDRSGPVARRWRPPDAPSRQAGGRHRLCWSTIVQPASATDDPCRPHRVAGSVTHLHTTQCGGPRGVEDQAAVVAVKTISTAVIHTQGVLLAVQHLVDALLLAFGMGFQLGYQVCLHLMIRRPSTRRSCRSGRLFDRPIRSRLVSRFRRRASPSSAPVGASRPSSARSIQVVLVTGVRGATCWPAAFSCRIHQSIR